MVHSLEITAVQMAFVLLAWIILAFYFWKHSLLRIETVVGFGPLPLELFVLVFPIFIGLLLWRVVIGGSAFVLLFLLVLMMYHSRLEHGPCKNIMHFLNFCCSYSIGVIFCWMAESHQPIMSVIMDPWLFLCLMAFLCIVITGYCLILICFHLCVYMLIRHLVGLCRPVNDSGDGDESIEMRPNVSFATLQLFENLDNPILAWRTA